MGLATKVVSSRLPELLALFCLLLSRMNLTPYEMNRKPHVLPDESSFIYAPPRFLENELSCSICLDILRNTRTTKECLHRFCEECIGQALRSGNKECPNCRKKLVSMRSLRPDPIFDTLIRTIFPNRAELDKQQSDLLAKLDKNNNAKAFLTSIEEGMRHQAEKRSGPRAPRKIGKDTNQDGLNTVCDAIPSASTSEAGSVRDAPAGREASDTTDYSMDTDGAIPAAASTAVPFLEKLKMKRKKKNLDLLADLEIVPLKDQIDGSQLVAKWKKRFVRVKAAATGMGYLS